MIKVYCPSCDFTCPYLKKKDLTCKMVDEDLNPFNECDDFYGYSFEELCMDFLEIDKDDVPDYPDDD